MNESLRWKKYELKYIIGNRIYEIRNRIHHKITGKSIDHAIKSYMGKKVLSIQETNTEIYNRILQGEPFFVGRLGGTEMKTIAAYLEHDILPDRNDNRSAGIKQLCELSGFFPEDIKLGEKFVELMIKATGNIDIDAVWNLYMEEWFLQKYASKDIILTRLSRLEPWYLYNEKERVTPWTAALKGKNVLVIHPFEESIIKQYNNNNREYLFKELGIDDILPEFNLHTLKAVQTLYNTTAEYGNWFEALEDMIQKCKQIEFDIAIIGCGAYGFPLASAIKDMGKIAIHLGGATQLLFGIKGKRWEENYSSVCDKMINKYWVKPLETEKIKDANAVEEGCYW